MRDFGKGTTGPGNSLPKRTRDIKAQEPPTEPSASGDQKHVDLFAALTAALEGAKAKGKSKAKDKPLATSMSGDDLATLEAMEVAAHQAQDRKNGTVTATPRPWYVYDETDEHNERFIRVGREGAGMIAIIPTPYDPFEEETDYSQAVANAEFIVRACNAYDQDQKDAQEWRRLQTLINANKVTIEYAEQAENGEANC